MLNYILPQVRWPDFRKENLYEAILDYQKRERRFGKTGDQITVNQIHYFRILSQ